MTSHSQSGGRIVEGDNLPVLQSLPAESVQLVYTDPPFNTGNVRAYQRLRTTRDDEGERVGFGGRRYRSESTSQHSFGDAFEEYIEFLAPRLREIWRVLRPDGTLYLHLDAREVHYVKVLLDKIFGRDCFLNEIIWAYDFGGRPKRRWPAKHDNILVYVKDREQYVFNRDEIDRIPYLAPGLVGKEKAERGKLPTDVWWHTIVGTNAKERTGYPTQKPVALAERIVRASSDVGELVLDPFAGSGTVGAAAEELGRRYLLVDSNPEAVDVMRARLPGAEVVRP
ncbi:MAG: site-specific DNA-methyltransferase [Chloroflexi bacterium]|nr:site-specific DNA-methyltransferase [Chloroflexota bacterium]MCY3587090.1 site-specific DNA-methyltransferase [Chloroflexota bacterium]MCY3685381.1 site-specific DNA-methyltransferase [Chloroflexota bacterium]MDE2707464.1 site-specific DNA-methyltransferase [Chloroflexota bacterium]